MDALTRQFLVKVAYEPFQGTLMPPGASFSDPRGLGTTLGQHLQQYPGYRPGSAEFNQYIAQNKFSPSYGQGLYTLQQRMLGVAQDPKAVQGMMQGQAPDLSPVYGDIGAAQFPAQSWSDWGKGVAATAAGYIPGSYGDAARAAMQQAKAQATSGVQQGVMGSLDRNSPFVRRMMSEAGTTYLGGKINDWTSGMGSFGRSLRGLGQFMLGVGSRMPGYESLVNTGIDWFGPKNMNQFFPATAQPQAQKQGSARAYSHYVSVYRNNQIEVLSPWTRR